MPRGQADYGIYTQTSLPAGIADPGEAAARLGSINVFDRRGWTLWQDDFEAPVLGWDATGFGGGILPVLDATRAVSGVQCAKLACGAVAGSTSTLRRHFPLARLGKIGTELWVQANSVLASYIRVTLFIYDGVNLTRARINYYPQAGTIYIETALGNILVASNIYMTQLGMYFLPIKLVADMDTDYYTRLIVGQQEIDISGYALFPAGATALRVVTAEVTLLGVVTAITEAYIDNFIFTVSEP